MRTKYNREFRDDEIVIFAHYRPARAECRPRQCKGGGEDCWVEKGPPAYTTEGFGRCRGCEGVPTNPGRAGGGSHGAILTAFGREELQKGRTRTK